jgi:hypothetical protein
LQTLRAFLIELGANKLLKAIEQHKPLTDKERQELIRHLSTYAMRISGPRPPQDVKIAIAKTAVVLFPCMDTRNEDTGGIVCIVYANLLVM